jgi:thymidine kinase
MLTVITGPMFSGKTTELIRRIRCAEIARQRTLVLKPANDTRSGLEVVSHTGLRMPAEIAEVASPLVLQDEVDVLGVDEAQFLSRSWVPVLDELASTGIEVVCACLNQDYLGRPFGIASQLLAMADAIVHLKSVCARCGAKDAATRTNRIAGGDARIEIGGADKYEPLCRSCWRDVRTACAIPEPLTAAVA